MACVPIEMTRGWRLSQVAIRKEVAAYSVDRFDLDYGPASSGVRHGTGTTNEIISALTHAYIE